MKLYGVKMSREYAEYLLIIQANNAKEARTVALREWYENYTLNSVKLIKVSGKKPKILMSGGMTE